MQYTCAEAAKLLRTLNEELRTASAREEKSCLFTAAVEEDLESVRPVYDYEAAQKEQDLIREKIRKVKHAINAFNLRTEVPGFHMTIDEILVYIPQLTEKKRKLTEMVSHLPKERVSDRYSSSQFIEYTYANYDIARAEEDLRAVTETLANAQLALDNVNTRETLDIEF